MSFWGLPTPTERVTRLAAKVLALGILAIGGLAMLYAVNPADPAGSPYYPKCLFHSITGLHCPGCGGLRAAHLVLHGRFSDALCMNPLAVCLAPPLAIALAWQNIKQRRGAAKSSLFSWRYHGWLLLVIVVAFTILRNIPVYPFTLLAPH